MTTNSTTEKEVQFVQEWIETNKDNKLEQPKRKEFWEFVKDNPFIFITFLILLILSLIK